MFDIEELFEDEDTYCTCNGDNVCGHCRPRSAIRDKNYPDYFDPDDGGNMYDYYDYPNY